MEKSVALVADSTCDLSPELIERYHIHILPLNITLGDTSYRDGAELTPDQIYDWVDKNGATPKTAAPNPADAVALLRPLAGAGMEILCFGISQEMSSSCQVMRLAAEEAGCRTCIVIDSENLSTGIGLQVLRAAELAESGLGAAEIAGQINAARGRVRASFVVDTLTYLYKGGRCGAVAALLGTALRLKPKIQVAAGRMGVGKKYRGAQSKVIADYVADLLPQLAGAAPAHVFITHSGVEEAVLAGVRQKLEALHRFREIHITRAGGVISSHCGPGTLGVLFYAE